MNNKPLTRKQRIALIDAWAELNCFCAYLENKEYYTDKYNPIKVCKDICKKLDSVVSEIADDDL